MPACAAARARSRPGSAAIALALVLASACAARGDDGVLERGRDLYDRECGKCHGLVAGAAQAAAGDAGGLVRASRTPRRLGFALPYGPPLAGVIGRPAGSVAGYDYSRAFRDALEGHVWSAASVDAFIRDSQAVAPGARMFYAEPDAARRAAIVRFLETTR